MATNRAAKLATFLTITAASPLCEAFAFNPTGTQQLQRVQLSAKSDDVEHGLADGWRKFSGGAAAFVTGLGIMTQAAFADPIAVSDTDGRESFVFQHKLTIYYSTFVIFVVEFVMPLFCMFAYRFSCTAIVDYFD